MVGAGLAGAFDRISSSLELPDRLEVPTPEHDPRWDRLQEASVQEYDHAHADPSIDVAMLYKAFDLYSSWALRTLHAEDWVLDVGCGGFVARPPYARSVPGRYAGLDPMDDGRTREYPFIRGRMEDLPGVIPPIFAGFLLSTSLDHVEDVAAFANAIQALAMPGAIATFLVGLHDPRIVAFDDGGAAYERMFADGSLVTFLREFAVMPIRLIREYRRLRRRGMALAEGRALDDRHYLYLTVDALPGALAAFGDVFDITRMPHTNVAMSAVRIRPTS